MVVEAAAAEGGEERKGERGGAGSLRESRQMSQLSGRLLLSVPSPRSLLARIFFSGLTRNRLPIWSLSVPRTGPACLRAVCRLESLGCVLHIYLLVSFRFVDSLCGGGGGIDNEPWPRFVWWRVSEAGRAKARAM